MCIDLFNSRYACVFAYILICRNIIIPFPSLKLCFFAKYYCIHTSDILNLHGLTMVYFVPDDRPEY